MGIDGFWLTFLVFILFIIILTCFFYIVMGIACLWVLVTSVTSAPSDEESDPVTTSTRPSRCRWPEVRDSLAICWNEDLKDRNVRDSWNSVAADLPVLLDDQRISEAILPRISEAISTT